MDAHVAKPIEPEVLFECLEHVTRVARRGERTDSKSGSIVGFDTRAALARVDGDVALLRELVELFLSEAPRLVGSMRDAIARGQPDVAARAAFDLRGAAANCAATAVEEAIVGLEVALRSGTAGAQTPRVEAVEQALAKLRPALESVLRRTTG
jgi:HPt (histidine-containing phosphotransfer) domain-containing protein